MKLNAIQEYHCGPGLVDEILKVIDRHGVSFTLDPEPGEQARKLLDSGCRHALLVLGVKDGWTTVGVARRMDDAPPMVMGFQTRANVMDLLSVLER